MAKVRGPVALGNEIQRVRTIFKHGYDAGLFEKPIRHGPEFRKPAQRLIRHARHAKGQRMLKPDDIKKLIQAASVPIRAMIYLAVNAGLGNSDCAVLPLSALDLSDGVLIFPRPKTGIHRRAILWPETIAALREAIEKRPKAKDPAHGELVFVTRFGYPWVRHNGKSTTDSIGLEFGKLLKRTGVECSGLFYVLRHIHRTISDEVGDTVACDLIMGHENMHSMSTRYIERIDDQRLRKVVDHVRQWLFGG